jgi:hypothetical protein
LALFVFTIQEVNLGQNGLGDNLEILIFGASRLRNRLDSWSVNQKAPREHVKIVVEDAHDEGGWHFIVLSGPSQSLVVVRILVGADKNRLPMAKLTLPFYYRVDVHALAHFKQPKFRRRNRVTSAADYLVKPLNFVVEVELAQLCFRAWKFFAFSNFKNRQNKNTERRWKINLIKLWVSDVPLTFSC